MKNFLDGGFYRESKKAIKFVPVHRKGIILLYSLYSDCVTVLRFEQSMLRHEPKANVLHFARFVWHSTIVLFNVSYLQTILK